MSLQSIFRFVFLLFLAQEFMTEARMTLPGCKEYCGNIRIPYPFGIGTDCSMDEWFEVVCNKTTTDSSTETAFIKSIDAEVLQFSIDLESNANILVVKGPVFSSNCSNRGGENATSVLNLEGSPYIFSRINYFFAFGCNTRATMSLFQPEIVGCESTCSGSDSEEGSRKFYSSACNGTNCCQTVIPAGLTNFGINLEKTNISVSREDECRLGFLANETWLQTNFETSDLVSSVMNLEYVPVVLKWVSIVSKINSKIVECYNMTTLQYSVTFECSCRTGYEGNPYIPNGDGCEDIDECKTSQNNCNSGATCVNTVGSFHCKDDNTWIIILGTCLGIGVFIALSGLWRLHKFVKKTRETRLKKKFFERNGGLLLQQQLSSNQQGNIDTMKVFTSKELEKATDNFNNNRVVGQGGEGTVYKGMLVDGRIVAVKKSIRVDEPKLGGFVNEIVILSQINHRNVVKLLGICLETEVPILVYEFIPNGNLFNFLHEKKDDPGHVPISWRMRLGIATEIAGALSYLHSTASFPIYHRDVKSMNILLNEKYRAILSDFGTSRLVTIDQTHLTTNVRGTFGYFDPEYFRSSQFTDKSDVYSFGVVLVELLTGQKPISSESSEEVCESLVGHFLLSIEERRLFDIVDPSVKQDSIREEFLAYADLAKRCLNLNGKNRPTMKEVYWELEQIACASRKALDLETKRKGSDNEELESGIISNSWDLSSFFYDSSTFSVEIEPLIYDGVVSK